MNSAPVEVEGDLVTISVGDRLAIHELIAMHGHLVDMGELDRMDELFTADVVYDVTAFGSGQLIGPAAIAAAARERGDGNPVGHHVTNICVAEDSDRTVRVRSKGIGVNTDGSVGSVVYEDVVGREPDGWRIASRTIQPRHTPLCP